MAAVIHLLGYPGVGKLTVAEALAATTAEDDPDRVVVVDNHLTGNPILRVITLDDTGQVPARAWELVADVRDRVHEAIAELSPPGWTFVFTNVVRRGDPLADRTLGSVQSVAERRGVPYVPVVLRCDPDEQRRRVVGAGRAERQKWTDPDAVAAHVARWDLAPPGGPNQLDLDITSLEPPVSATVILDHVRSL